MNHWLNYISTISTFLPMMASLYMYRLLDQKLKILSWFFVFASVVEVVVFVTACYKANNLWLINIFTIAEGFIFCYIPGKWSESKKIFLLTMGLFSVYFIYWLYSTSIAGHFLELNGNEKTLKGLILIFISGFFLIRLSVDESVVLLNDYRFWIAASILVYFSLTLIVFSTASFFLENHHATYFIWIIHSLANIISNLLFTFGFIWYYRKTNSFT